MKDFNLTLQNKLLIGSFMLFVLLYFVLNKKIPEPKLEKTNSSADSFIPDGYVLVPIQIENSTAFSGLIEQFALVDLYAYSEISKNNALIASKVKLIRAPNNPNQFAVLATETESRQIMQIKTSFLVVLQNNKNLQANLEKNKLSMPLPKFVKKPLNTTRIEYFSEL